MDVCTHIISDRLYFIDNLLCLLSNAVEYSDRGATIDVYIEIIKDVILPNAIMPVVNATKEDVLAVQLYDDGVKCSASSKLGSIIGSFIGTPVTRGSLRGSTEHKSKHIGSTSSTTPNHGVASGLKLAQEINARLMLENPLSEIVQPAMLVVRVVDSGIGLSGGVSSGYSSSFVIYDPTLHHLSTRRHSLIITLYPSLLIIISS